MALAHWKEALSGCNVDDAAVADPVSRGLVISRACVFSMTASSALIGVLLAAADGFYHWFLALLCLVGLVLNVTWRLVRPHFLG